MSALTSLTQLPVEGLILLLLVMSQPQHPSHYFVSQRKKDLHYIAIHGGFRAE